EARMASVMFLPSWSFPSTSSSSERNLASTCTPPSSVTHLSDTPSTPSEYPSHLRLPNHLPLRLLITSQGVLSLGSSVLSSIRRSSGALSGRRAAFSLPFGVTL